MIYVILASLPPSPTYNVGGVNESQSHLMLLMLKLQHSQIPNIVSGGGGVVASRKIKACTPPIFSKSFKILFYHFVYTKFKLLSWERATFEYIT